MLLSHPKKWLAIAAGLMISFNIYAAVTTWQIVPAKSHLTFTATQNNSPVTGEFKNFTGDILFDPNDLKNSSVNIVVDLASITTSLKEVGDTLKTPDWFDIKLFPHATFKANQFTKTGKDAYQANGILTLRDKNLPLVLNFTLDEYSATNAHVRGIGQFKRSAYGVGRGEWASTDNVKDDVKVNFDVTTVKK